MFLVTFVDWYYLSYDKICQLFWRANKFYSSPWTSWVHFYGLEAHGHCDRWGEYSNRQKETAVLMTSYFRTHIQTTDRNDWHSVNSVTDMTMANCFWLMARIGRWREWQSRLCNIGCRSEAKPLIFVRYLLLMPKRISTDYRMDNTLTELRKLPRTNVSLTAGLNWMN